MDGIRPIEQTWFNIEINLSSSILARDRSWNLGISMLIFVVVDRCQIGCQSFRPTAIVTAHLPSAFRATRSHGDNFLFAIPPTYKRSPNGCISTGIL